jgi:hypothetical protein
VHPTNSLLQQLVLRHSSLARQRQRRAGASSRPYRLSVLHRAQLLISLIRWDQQHIDQQGRGDLCSLTRLGRLHIRVLLRWGSRWARRLLVVTGAGARCPLTKPAVVAVELQATIEPTAAEACSPAVFAHTWCSGGAGPGWRSGRRRFPCQLPLCRSGAMCYDI